MISLIVAHTRNRIIGKDGTMPWHIPGELKRFRDLTMGNAVIMGRRSFEDLEKPLPGRLNIVLTSTGNYEGENLVTARSLEEAIRLAGDRKIFIGGGGKVYKEALPITDVLYITEIDAEIDGDTYFPEFDKSQFDRVVEKHVDGDLPYDYVTYYRKK